MATKNEPIRPQDAVGAAKPAEKPSDPAGAPGGVSAEKVDRTDMGEKASPGVAGAQPDVAAGPPLATAPQPPAGEAVGLPPQDPWPWTSGRRFSSREDVCLGLERLMQMTLLGSLPPAMLKDLSAVLRALGSMMPKDAAPAAAVVSRSLRERIAREPGLLVDLQYLLTEEQLRQLLEKPRAEGAPSAGGPPALET